MEARPSQHISSIAHLFFDNSTGKEHSPETASSKQVLVVGTGRDTCAPYTAVGLGQHFLDQSITVGERGNTESTVPIRQVFFAEPSPVCFSGVSHLPKGSYRSPVSGETTPWAVRHGSSAPVLRIYPGQVPSEDVSGGMVAGRFYIRHLDLPREAELGALETVASLGQSTDLDLGENGSLLWCVSIRSAVSLSLVGRLGRLLKVVSPSSIHVLVYSDRGRIKKDSLPGAKDDLLRRCARLVEYVANGTPVHPLLMGDSAQQQNIQLASLSRQISL